MQNSFFLGFILIIYTIFVVLPRYTVITKVLT